MLGFRLLVTGSLALLLTASASPGQGLPAAGALPPALQARIEDAKAASVALAKTHFFANGHGMHVIPDMRSGAKKLMDAQAKYQGKKFPKRAEGELFPEEIEVLRDKMGITFYEGKPLGFALVQEEGVEVGVLNCVSCHSGRAAGMTLVGLGNKQIDMAMVGQFTLEKSRKYLDALVTYNRKVREAQRKVARAKKMIAVGDRAANALDTHGYDAWAAQVRDRVRALRRKIPRVPGAIRKPDEELTQDALEVASLMADAESSNQTQGMVSMSLVHGPFLEDLDKGRVPSVKVPHLWGLTQKRRVGLFCDGMADGVELGWFASTELSVGQTPDTMRGYLDQMGAVANQVDALMAPPYPFRETIDKGRAMQGFLVFQKNCAECHGTYERDEVGAQVFDVPKPTIAAVVGTDDERLRMVTSSVRQRILGSPLADVMKVTDLASGYLAPRLEGIWARFPYLHNASVPTLEALLRSPEERPRAFSLLNSGEVERFDRDRVGLTVPPPETREAAALEELGRKGERSVYWTGRPGHSNRGHEFGTTLKPEEKQALLEYLKCL